MLSFRHCTAALLLLSMCAAARAQTPPGTPPAPARQTSAEPAAGSASFTVFLRGTDVGRVQTALARSGRDWVLTSTGRVGPLIVERLEIKYGADWQPIELRIEATQANTRLQLATSFGVTTAINEITRNGVTNTKTDQVSARTIPLPNQFFGAYEALAARLAVSGPGAQIPIYVVPEGEVVLTVDDVALERVQTPAGRIETRRYDVTIANPGGALTAAVVVDGRSRFARLDIPSAGFSVVRSDLASVAARTEAARNPTDVDVSIPASGFNLAGTLTTPPQAAGRMRYPAVVLVGGSGPVDRDGTVAGIPVFAQLAGALADRGFVVLRYDRRGIGQSGGRTETATLQDYAEDVRAAVKWLQKRKDVDKRRLAVVGHGEGGSIAMLAAAREKKIKALVLVATPGTTGAELVLEQQRRQLDLMNLTNEERDAKVALQQQIQHAVTTGEGWEELPEELRRQADTPWFRSLLAFDPADVMRRIKQPILIVSAALDAQVPPHHAGKLAALAEARKKAPPVDVVTLEGVNHLLVPARTGEVREYQELTARSVTPQATASIADWLKDLQPR